MENKYAQKAATNTTTEQSAKHDKGYKRLFSRKRNFLHFLNKYIKSGNAEWVKFQKRRGVRNGVRIEFHV